MNNHNFKADQFNLRYLRSRTIVMQTNRALIFTLCPVCIENLFNITQHTTYLAWDLRHWCGIRVSASVYNCITQKGKTVTMPMHSPAWEEREKLCCQKSCWLLWAAWSYIIISQICGYFSLSPDGLNNSPQHRAAVTLCCTVLPVNVMQCPFLMHCWYHL